MNASTLTTDLAAELNKAMEEDLPGAKLRHEAPFRPNGLPRATSLEARSPHQQLEAFMASSRNMLEIQRKNLLDTESEYQIERVRLLDSYRIKLENLKHECNEAVRELDQKHRQNIADTNNLLERLAAMRALD